MPGSVLSKRVRLADSTDPLAASSVAIAGRPSADPRQHWRETFRSVRAETERRAALLSPEDQVVQSMPDASPTKWHRAHVTWFFEQFLLKPYVKNYTPFDERFAYLYNSYYVSAGPRAARPQRGLVTRPSAAEIAAYRAHVDAAVADLIETASDFDQIVPIIEIGLNHEQQHQELLLTDILHAFSLNETSPAYDPDWQWPSMDQRAVAAVDAIRPRYHRPRRRQLLLRQRRAGASDRAAPGMAFAAAGQQRRVVRFHGRWRLHHADAVAVGRFRDRRGARLERARAIGARSTARGSR